MYHFCPRTDCKHNNGGHCTFFIGDIYFSECLDDAFMYQKRDDDTNESE